MSPFKSFMKSEDGAVTVDFVVLTAGIAALGAAVMLSVGGAAKSTADEIATEVDGYSVMTF